MNKILKKCLSVGKAIAKDRRLLIRYILFYAGKSLHYPLLMSALVVNKLRFRNEFSIKCFNTEDRASHFLFKAKSYADGKEYLLKSNNYFFKKYVQSLGRKFLSDQEKYEILKRLKASQVGEHVPSAHIVRGQLLIVFIAESVDLGEYCRTHSDPSTITSLREQIVHFFTTFRSLGYVHMDIKTKNILVDSTGRVIVIDWDNLDHLTKEKGEYDEKMLAGVLAFLQNVEQSRGK